MTTLKRQTISGFKWLAFGDYALIGLSFITFIILARLLDPPVFGLFTMAFIAIDGLGLFKDMGIDSALIQRKEKIEEACHTVFWMMPVLGIFIYIVLFFGAPWAALALKQENLVPIIRILGVIFILGSFENVPLIILRKGLQFRKLVIREIISSSLYSFTAVLLAFWGAGIWSLVYAYLIKRVSMLYFSWKISSYKPKMVFDKQIAYESFHFGKFIFGASVIYFLINNVDNFFVGRILGAAALGYYALALNVSSLTTKHLSVLIGRVMFPAYSKIQDDRAALKRIQFKIMKTLPIISFPFGILLILMGEEIVKVIYGAKWLPMVPSLKVLAVSAMLLPIAATAVSIFRACKKPEWEFIRGLVSIAVLIIGVPVMITRFNILGVAITVTFAGLVVLCVDLVLMRKLLAFRWQDVLQALKPTFLSSAVFASAIFIIKSFIVFGIGRTWLNMIHLGAFLTFAAALYMVILHYIDAKAIPEVRSVILNK